MTCKCYCEVKTEQEIGVVPSEGYNPYFFPSEGAYLPFFFTDASFTRVLSALVNGAIATYGDEAYSVVWEFLRNVEYPMSDGCAWLVNLLETCEDVQDSIFGIMQYGIGNVPSVQNAFREWWLADEAMRTVLDQRYSVPVLLPELAKTSVLKPSECGPDYIFNQVTAFVDMVNTLSEDLFEAIEVGTNALERWQIATSAIPVLGQAIPVDEGLAFVDQIVEEVQELYVGAYDIGLRNDIRCEIFCIAKDSCELSLDQLIAYYEGKVTGLSLEDPITLLQNIIEFTNTGVYPGDLPVYTIHLLILALIRAAGDVFGIDFANMYLEIIAAGDTPNNDWETICDDCGITGEWELYPDNPYSTSQPVGVFTAQSAGSFDVDASLGGDGVYRVALQRPLGCVQFDVWSPTETVNGNHGCVGWVSGPPFAGSPNFQDHFYVYAAVPFSIHAEWTP